MTQPRIVWIASYPKSGNTWARFLLANLLFGRVETSQAIEEMVPDVHRGKDVAARWHRGGTIFVKTHWALAEDMPHRAATAGVIYVVRHPLDVLRSHIDYYGLREDPERLGIFVDMFIAEGGVPAWLRRRYGTWLSNVTAWMGESVRLPRLLLRYEDMKADPTVAVTRMAEFFALKPDEVDVPGTVENASFERMRSMEEAELAAGTEGFFVTERTHAERDGFRFMSQGTVGGWKDLLSPAQIDAARARFGVVARQIGYEI